MSYYLPFGPDIALGQRFGENPGWGPNPAGGHNGDDWLTPVGTPVRSPGDGEVVYAGRFDSTYADNWGWNINYAGQMVILNMDGEAGPYFEFGHLSKLLVKTGQRVTAGQLIALTGADDGGTGVITGPHCHVGCLPPNFNLGTNTYGRVNPRLYMTRYWDGAAIQTQSTTTNAPKEDTLSAAEVKEIKDHINAVLLGGYTWSDGKHPGIGMVVEEEQRRAAKDRETLPAAIAAAVWATPVKRASGNVSALQELADAKTKVYGMEPVIARIDTHTDPAALADLIPDSLAQQVIDKLAERLGK